MKIEDALLGCTVDATAVEDLAAWCRAAADGGADAVELAGGLREETGLGEAASACREAQTLCFIRDDAALAGRIAADGVVLSGTAEAIGAVRSKLTGGGLAACRVASPDEARLAVGLGADFLVAAGEATGAAAVNGPRGAAAVPVFVEVSRPEGARTAGAMRWWVPDATPDQGRIRDEMARYARLLGRCI